MINICIVDYYNQFKTNGLNTYLNQLIPFLKKDKKLQVHYIWVNSFIDHKEFAKKTDKAGNVHLYLPKDIAVLTDVSANDLQAAERWLFCQIRNNLTIMVPGFYLFAPFL